MYGGWDEDHYMVLKTTPGPWEVRTPFAANPKGIETSTFKINRSKSPGIHFTIKGLFRVMNTAYKKIDLDCLNLHIYVAKPELCSFYVLNIR